MVSKHIFQFPQKEIPKSQKDYHSEKLYSFVKLLHTHTHLTISASFFRFFFLFLFFSPSFRMGDSFVWSTGRLSIPSQLRIPVVLAARARGHGSTRGRFWGPGRGSKSQAVGFYPKDMEASEIQPEHVVS